MLNQQVNRARLALDLNKLFSDNVEERKFFYRLDYSGGADPFKFDPAKFPHSDDERHLDSLLYKLSQIGYLIKHRTIGPRDVLWVRSIARTVLEHPEVHEYLKWLPKSAPGHSSFSDLKWLYKEMRPAVASNDTTKVLWAYSYLP